MEQAAVLRRVETPRSPVAAALPRLLAWDSLAALLLLVALLIPPRRYTLPSSLPFEAEPYRLVLGLVLLAWIASLLVDPKVKLRRTILSAPLAVFICIVLLSLLVNHERASAVSSVLTKQLMFFALVVLIVPLFASVLTSVVAVTRVIKALVLAGGVIAVAAIIEARTGTNLFDSLGHVLPFLEPHNIYEANTATDSRGARTRALASSQHPIELGAILVMLMPLAFGLAHATKQRRWWFVLVLLLPAALGALSRTTVPMVAAVVLVGLWLRRREVSRLWVLLIPLVVVAHFVVPGALGGLTKSFFPEGGLIAQQSDASVGSGRIATLGPTLRNELAQNPVLGVGFGTRITTDDDPNVPANAPILDNQWLGVLLETGILGLVCLLWLFLRFIRRCGERARDDRGLEGWLLTGLCASTAAAMVGMLTFDAFSFNQLTLLLFSLFGLGAALMRVQDARSVPTTPPIAAVAPTSR